MPKRLSLSRAKRILKIDEDKLDWALQYYAGDKDFEHLTPTQQDMLEKYKKAWGMLSMGRTAEMVRQTLMKDYEIQDRQARYIIEEARILYGQVDQVDLDGRKQASIAFYDLLSNIAFKDKDVKEARECRKEADTIAGVYKSEQIGLNPEDFLKASKIVFVNNINVFKKQQDAIDIPFDE